MLRPVVLVPSGQGVGRVLASACSSSLSGAELCVLRYPTFPREASLACCPPEAWPKSLHSVFSASQSSILPLPGFTAVTATSPVSSHRTRLPPHSRDIYICGSAWLSGRVLSMASAGRALSSHALFATQDTNSLAPPQDTAGSASPFQRALGSWVS